MDAISAIASDKTGASGSTASSYSSPYEKAIAATAQMLGMSVSDVKRLISQGNSLSDIALQRDVASGNIVGAVREALNDPQNKQENSTSDGGASAQQSAAQPPAASGDQAQQSSDVTQQILNRHVADSSASGKSAHHSGSHHHSHDVAAKYSV